ncbi:MAG: glycosyltransferase family 4 protein [Muribaculaceae bacterium]|nr:glycosyltransferase family 4 protein [Muribaculaceae bacterium]
MRILLINDFLEAGGAEIVFHKMKDALRDSGHEVDIFFGKEKPEPSGSPLSYIYNFKTVKNLNLLLKEKRYSIVIVFNYTSVLSPALLQVLRKHKRLQGFRVLYNAHDAHLICPNSGLNYFDKGEPKLFKEYASASEFIWRRVDYRGWIYSLSKKMQWLLAYRILNLHKVFDKVLSPGIFLLQRIRRFYPSLDGTVLRNPCLGSKAEAQSGKISNDGSPLPASPLGPASRNKCGANNCVRLLFVGRLSYEKGILPFLKALRGFQREYIFDIYGTGSLEKEISDEIRRSGLTERVSLKGARSHDEILSLMSDYDALVLPSSGAEFAPLSIVEAAAHGLFIMTVPQGGMKEMAEEVDNYIFIDPVSTQSIEKAMETISLESFRPSDLKAYTFQSYKEALQHEIEE